MRSCGLELLCADTVSRHVRRPQQRIQRRGQRHDVCIGTSELAACWLAVALQQSARPQRRPPPAQLFHLIKINQSCRRGRVGEGLMGVHTGDSPIAPAILPFAYIVQGESMSSKQYKAARVA